MFDWQVAATPGWITVKPNGGKQSEGAVTLDVEIDRNTTERQRENVITIIPLPTEFYKGVEIDPAKVGIKSDTIKFIQFGGQQPAISIPWLSDGITQKNAELTFNYYSPYIEIKSAGLEWRKESADKWNKKEASVSDGNAGTVTVELPELEPATKYVARGYVIDANGKEYPGSACLTFSTAGQYPESGDNPTPGI